MTESGIFEIAKSDVCKAVSLSGVLGSSKNQIALFKFLLNHKYSEPTSELKTKDIAVAVFDKDDSFSAKKDSIVRVEMFRLRANLDTFNQQSEFLKVKLPKSSYALSIEKLVPVPAVELPSNIETGDVKSLHKKKFIGAGLAVVAGAIILVSTSAFNAEPKGIDCSKTIPNLQVFKSKSGSDLNEYVHQVISGAASQFSHFNIVQDVKSCAFSNVPGYRLEYVLLQNDADFQGSLSVTSQQNTKIVGVNNFSGVSIGGVSDLSLRREDLYFTIVKITNDLFKPAGVVHRDAINQTWKDTSMLEDYSCILKMHESFVSDSDTDYNEGLKCLETAYENGTTSLDNLGGLAASYLEQAQGNRGANNDEPLLRAKSILDDIGDRWLQSTESTIAKIMYDAIRDDYNEQRLRETLLRAERAYISHPTVMLEVSRYSGFKLGEWGLAANIIKRVRRLVSDNDNSVYLVDAAYAVLGKGDPSAWTNCVKAYSEHSKVSNLLMHSCAVKYKKPIWEARAAENLTKFKLLQITERRAFIKSMGFEPLLSEALLVTPKSNFYD